jgi:hypothetical protein
VWLRVRVGVIGAADGVPWAPVPGTRSCRYPGWIGNGSDWDGYPALRSDRSAYPAVLRGPGLVPALVTRPEDLAPCRSSGRVGTSGRMWA